ncbi:MAG: amidase family protein [Bacilli bacterium]
MHILDLTISEIHRALVNKEITPRELVDEAFRRLESDTNNVFETSMKEQTYKRLATLGEPEKDNVFWGIPFMIKDNFSTKGVLTTASSDILNGYIPVFDATVVKKLYQAKALPIAKATMDELAMGGSGVTGHKGPTFNPYDIKHEHIIGGSSSGSAAAVAAGIVPFALGSDTGDSVRKPASHGGLVGFKATWGRISRYGLFPFVPSLDHVGYFTRSVEDAAHALNLLSGYDKMDTTSSIKPVENYVKKIHDGIENARIAVLNQVYSSITDAAVRHAFDHLVENVKAKGIIVDFVDIDEALMRAIYPTYIVLSCAEATSNNANLDGIRFGQRKDGETYQDIMTNSRTAGFSPLIKRRFLIGSFALMRENQFELYQRAQKARRLIVDAVNKIFDNYDAILLPAAPSVAPKFNADSDALSDEYLIADNHLAIGNFGGFPSLTLPLGFKDNLPFGVNVTGRPYADADVLAIAYQLENIIGYRNLSTRRMKQ